MARRAGLDRALEQFPDDVTAAANAAVEATKRVRASGSPLEPSREPWPPMLVARK
ncbi:hypothetical protein [Bradyrhizobium sp.]|uniref:hypothetical protein n=1 Tax=Bradyrhizobium sp. TaxID=376 RepID=UPI0025B7BF3B|nr:hypothetical protein [Bradyrhizobium sp.]